MTVFLRHEFGKLLKSNPMRDDRLPAPIAGQNYMLYVHIPFCEVLCPYCTFHRVVCGKEYMKSYFAQLRHEMFLVARLGYRFHSMYVGGGTPTILMDELAHTIDLACELFGIREVSCETNPNHLEPEMIGMLRGRVQRLSVGVQSFDDGLLRYMKRYEKYGSGMEILQRIEKVAGIFPTLNIDLIFNFPNQSEQILEDDLKKAIHSEANQVTFYPLMTSTMVKRAISDTIGKVDYRREARYYWRILNALSKNFTAKSAWTFSRNGQGMIDEYIVECDDYVGIGSGAFSYLGGRLYINTFSLMEYERALSEGSQPLSKMISFSRYDQMRYNALMSLFGLRLDKRRFRQIYHISVEQALWLEVLYLRLVKAFERDDEDVMTLTPMGRYMMVVMMRAFFSNMNDFRERARSSLPEEEHALLAVESGKVLNK